MHVKDLPGKPDIVLKQYRTVIFIQDCFWHGYEGCRYFKIPETRREWWINKINRTKELDSNNLAALRKEGWQVIEIWECELRPKTVTDRLDRLPDEIISGTDAR